MTSKEHWDSVYATKSPDEVSWYRPHLEQSLRWIGELKLDPSASIVDIGGGASTLVDDLIAAGHRNLAVADLSENALSRAQQRLGALSSQVQWIVGDATTSLFPAASVDLWHDRAVFHFLTDPAQRQAYADQLDRSLTAQGVAILATFGPEGPERCSGFPIRRYTSQELATELGARFALVDSAHEVHITPWGAEQAFSYAMLRRR